MSHLPQSLFTFFVRINLLKANIRINLSIDSEAESLLGGIFYGPEAEETTADSMAQPKRIRKQVLRLRTNNCGPWGNKNFQYIFSDIFFAILLSVNVVFN